MKYAQLLKSTAQGRFQNWYICGREPALVQDAYDLAQDHVTDIEVDVVKTVFFGADTSALELERELLRDFDEDRQMVVLLDADKFRQWDLLAPLLKETGVERFFIAVASSALPEDTRKFFTGSTRSRYVVCDELTEKEQRILIETHLAIQRDAADFLVQRARGDYGWLLNQVHKLMLVAAKDGPVSVELLKKLSTGYGVPSFTQALMTQNKPAAVSALDDHVPTPLELSTLLSTLVKYVTLNVARRTLGLTPRLLIERTGMTQKEISVFGSSAIYYDSQVTAKCYAALLRLHEGLVRGSRPAYQALITRW